jgi:periplasmic protein TonB
MAAHHVFLFGPPQAAPTKKPEKALRLPGNVQNDVFLSALLEMPTTKRTPRNPLEWAGAMGLHIVILAALIIVPLYTTGTIHLSEHEVVPLVAPPPALPAAPAVGHVAPRMVNPHAPSFAYKLQKLAPPSSVPKKVSSESVAEAAPDLGVAGGVPGGVPGGVIGGTEGIIGGTGLAAPPPPSAVKPAPKVVRVGSNLKAPRQTHSVDPEYPTLARQTHIIGTVVVEAIIDEHGNVVQARAISGQPLLVPAALRAVLQWKYEPSFLNGQPISVELQVQVHFNLNSHNS